MSRKNLQDLALQYCMEYHRGETRKGNKLPYHTHPIAVRDILIKYEFTNPNTLIIALLHDTIENTNLTLNKIEKDFNKYTRIGVSTLSKNTLLPQLPKPFSKLFLKEYKLTIENLYKLRILFADSQIQAVKIADTIHNTQDLESLISEDKIIKKINDANSFYIPLAHTIKPQMAKELKSNIETFIKNNPEYFYKSKNQRILQN